MTWLQILLFILELLKDLRTSKDETAFMASATAKRIGDGAILIWLWEHREEIINLIIRLIDEFTEEGDVRFTMERITAP